MLKKDIQKKLSSYSEIFSDINEICALYVIDLENKKYVRKIQKHRDREEYYTALFQKGFVLFTDDTMQQAVFETTQYNTIFKKVEEGICFVFVAEKSLSFGQMITLMKQRTLIRGE